MLLRGAAVAAGAAVSSGARVGCSRRGAVADVSVFRLGAAAAATAATATAATRLGGACAGGPQLRRGLAGGRGGGSGPSGGGGGDGRTKWTPFEGVSEAARSGLEAPAGVPEEEAARAGSRLFDGVDVAAEDWREQWRLLKERTPAARWAEMEAAAAETATKLRESHEAELAELASMGGDADELRRRRDAEAAQVVAHTPDGNAAGPASFGGGTFDDPTATEEELEHAARARAVDPGMAQALMESLVDHMHQQHAGMRAEAEEAARSPWRKRFEREADALKQNIGVRRTNSGQPVTAQSAAHERQAIAQGLNDLRAKHQEEFGLAVHVTGEDPNDLYHGNISAESRAHLDQLTREGLLGALDWSTKDAFDRDPTSVAPAAQPRVYDEAGPPQTSEVDAAFDALSPEQRAALRESLGLGNLTGPDSPLSENEQLRAGVLTGDDMLKIAMRAASTVQQRNGSGGGTDDNDQR